MRRPGAHGNGASMLPPLGRGDASSAAASASSSVYDTSMSSGSSVDQSNREDKGGNAMEYELTNAKLKNLEAIFLESDTDGGGGLDMEEFRGAMRQTMGDHVSDDELDRIFMKVDTNCDGTVDWDEYLTFMLLECREKDSMNIKSRQPFPREPRIVSAPHRDSIVRVLMVPNFITQQNRSLVDMYRGRYVSVSREGAICFWSTDFKLLASHKIDPPLDNSKSIWVTDVAVMARAQMMAVGTTSRDLMFYDIAANRFRCVTKVTSLDSCPTAMHFWAPLTMSIVDGPTANLCLIWGNARGGIGALCFGANPDTTVLNPKQSQPHRRRIAFAEILSGAHPKIKAYALHGIHKDVVHEVTYLHHTRCFMSCSRDTETAMFMGDFERKMHNCYFRVTNGVFSFEYVPSLNIIVSGGYDAIVRVWNPYVPSKPVIVLQGHKSPITQVKVNTIRETIISVADNKEIRIFDLNTQTCIQTFYRKMLPGMGPRPFTAVLLNERRQALILATTKLLCLEHREEDLRTLKTITHSQPVTTALYNPLFQQVVSVGSGSLVCVWHLFSGDKVMQFTAYKVRRNGVTVDLEITAMSFDPTYRRLITAARDGAVKIFNFNNGACLREMPVYDRCEITAIVCPKGRIMTGGWNKRVTLYVDSGEDDDTVTCLRPSHRDDVMSLALHGQNVLASGSYDGDIMIWSLETGRMLHCLNCRRGAFPHTPANEVRTGFYTPGATPTAIPGDLNVSTTKPKLPRGRTTPDACQRCTPVLAAAAPPVASSLLVARFSDNTPGQGTDSQADKRARLLPLREKSSDSHDSSATLPDPHHHDTPPRTRQRKRDAEAEFIISKLLFLQSRENLPECATLLASYSDGYVRAWSVHHNGGLLGEFVGAHKRGLTVHAMATDEQNIYLITGDTQGYLKVWDISNYCTGRSLDPTDPAYLQREARHNRFPIVRYKRQLASFTNTSTWLKDVANDATMPPLLTSFRGHLQFITCVDFVHVNGKNFILSGSHDCSIRLWTLTGEFIGTFGQKSLWNPGRRMEREPSPKPQDLLLNLQQRPNFLPPDVRRVASATTLWALNGGRRSNWTLVRNVVTWLTRFSKGPDKFIALEKPTRSTMTFTQDECEPCTPRSSILGLSYKRTTRHHPLPVLPKIRHSQNKIAAYNSLPFVDLSPVMELKEPDVLKEMRQRQQAQALEKQAHANEMSRRGKGHMQLMKVYRRIGWMNTGRRKSGGSTGNPSEQRLDASSGVDQKVSGHARLEDSPSSGRQRSNSTSKQHSGGPSRSQGGASVTKEAPKTPSAISRQSSIVPEASLEAKNLKTISE